MLINLGYKELSLIKDSLIERKSTMERASQFNKEDWGFQLYLKETIEDIKNLTNTIENAMIESVTL